MSDEKKTKAWPLRLVRSIYVGLRGYFAILGLLITLAPLVIGYFATHAGIEAPKTKLDYSSERPARLQLGLHGPVVEKQPGMTERFFERLFGEEAAIYLPELRKTLKQAANDPGIARLELEIANLRGSWADFAELRRLLVEFRDKGKSLTAILVDGSDWNYYVASAAEHIVLNPASSLMIPGPVFNLTYFGEGLKKLGVEMDVVRAGKYKSAFEPFIANEPSAATLEQYQTMEESLRSHIVEAVAASRGQKSELVRSWFKRSIYTASEAQTEGLVDAIGYDADAGALPAASAREAAIKFEDYAAQITTDPKTVATGDAGIALIEAIGEISMDDAKGISSVDGITPLAMRRELNWAQTNDKVKAVVLRISSPGGGAVAADLIWNDVRKLAAEKPVVVSMGAYAASGGYYIAAPAQKLIAEPTTITGSIGVIGMIPRLGAFKDKYGVSFHIVTQSERADLLNPGGKGSDSDRALLNSTIEQVYKTFVEKVARGRKVPESEIEARAQGRVYTGLQALEQKLVDDIGGLPVAFKAAKELAGFDTEKLYPVYQYEPEEFDLRKCLSGPEQLMRCLGEGGASTIAGAFKSHLAQAQSNPVDKVAARLGSWVGQGAMMVWPGYLNLEMDRPKL